MANLEVQDPILPDAEPMLLLGDDADSSEPITLELRFEATPTSTCHSHPPPPKVLVVRHQAIQDALGNVGNFTGQIDVATNLPHGHGEMIYSRPAGETPGNNDHNSENNNPSAVPTLVTSHQGAWENGYWQGHGTQILNNGDSFVGEFNKSVRVFGEYRWKEEEQTAAPTGKNTSTMTIRKQRSYQGGFHENGRPHGHGKYTWTTSKIVPATQHGSNSSSLAEVSSKSVSTYVGMFENGQRQGHGVFTSSALHYTGDWEQGKYHGYGVLKIFGKRSIYRGQFRFGKRDGKGEEVLEDGTVVHEGLWRQDRPIKHQDMSVVELDDYQEHESSLEQQKQPLPTSTVFQTPQEIVDGEGITGMYKGIVEDLLPSGVGTITYEKLGHPTGIIRYEGFFDQGIRQGYGRADFGNGDGYQGNWTNGVFEGNGEYTFKDGRFYKGTWTQGLPHDTNAKFTWPSTDMFEGVYEHGRRKSGRIVFANGAYYEGEFFSPEGSYGGQGKLVTFMVSYQGEFRDGVFHGQGCLKKNSGFIIYDGEWKDGKAVRDDVLISIPTDLLDVPLPPPDDDFGEFDDGPEATDILTSLKRTRSPLPQVPRQSSLNLNGNEGSLGVHPTLSETILGTSSRLLESIASSFSVAGSEEVKSLQETCKAVVDMSVSDAQDNPGRFTGILHMESQRPHGVGRMVYQDGNRIHEGFWSYGNREGHGRCMFAKIGDFHEGEYKDNLRHGPGKYFWKDGRRFIGNYHLDERSGEGKFIYPNGDVYNGNFERGARSGFGVLTFSNKTCEYRGEWKASMYNGSGMLKWQTEFGVHVYEGNFEGGKFHGQGVEFQNDEIKRKGWWENGSYRGEQDPAVAAPTDLLELPLDKEALDNEEDNDAFGHPMEAIEKVPSKDECPTSLEQSYSDVRFQWKNSLEPQAA